ncbi:MAG TPA: hypothetical protein VHO69_04915 [Phototrophicaceae bacterium]|nr:hypothetical protein [Phototrophicaceae bacterium]
MDHNGGIQQGFDGAVMKWVLRSGIYPGSEGQDGLLTVGNNGSYESSGGRQQCGETM